MNKNLYTNGFLVIFEIHFYNTRGTPSHLLRRTDQIHWFRVMYYLVVHSGMEMTLQK
jgi:hypothetical protein